jgi:protein-arginine kinase activator protein McsA
MICTKCNRNVDGVRVDKMTENGTILSSTCYQCDFKGQKKADLK